MWSPRQSTVLFFFNCFYNPGMNVANKSTLSERQETLNSRWYQQSHQIWPWSNFTDNCNLVRMSCFSYVLTWYPLFFYKKKYKTPHEFSWPPYSEGMLDCISPDIIHALVKPKSCLLLFFSWCIPLFICSSLEF